MSNEVNKEINAKISVGEDAVQDKKSVARRKILLLVLSLLCVGAMILLVVVHSGTPIVDFLAIAGSFDPVDTRIEEVKELEGVSGELVRGEGVLALYEGEDEGGFTVYTVVNLASGKVVGSYADTQEKRHDIALHKAMGDGAWFSLTVTEERGTERIYARSFLDAEGKVFAEKTEMDALALSGLIGAWQLDLVRMEDEVFRIDTEGRAKAAFTLSRFADFPEFTHKVGDCYYIVPAQPTDPTYVYDGKANLTAVYAPPEAAQSPACFILADGTLLAQYITDEGEDAKDYTYAEKGRKYLLHHILISAKTGERRTLDDLDFYIVGPIISDNDALHALGLNTAIDNLVTGYYVKDHLLDMSSHERCAVLLSNRGRITSAVGNIVAAMDTTSIVGVAKNRWIAGNLAGEYFLLNEWGGIVGRFPSVAATDTYYARSLFIHDRRIYDWNLELLYDMEENGIVDFELVGSSVLMESTEGEMLLYNGEDGEVKTLKAAGEKKTVEVLAQALVLCTEEAGTKTQIKIYNEAGETVLQQESDGEILVKDAHSHLLDGRAVVHFAIETDGQLKHYLGTAE